MIHFVCSIIFMQMQEFNRADTVLLTRVPLQWEMGHAMAELGTCHACEGATARLWTRVLAANFAPLKI